jgi:hypothetical protein
MDRYISILCTLEHDTQTAIDSWLIEDEECHPHQPYCTHARIGSSSFTFVMDDPVLFTLPMSRISERNLTYVSRTKVETYGEVFQRFGQRS